MNWEGRQQTAEGTYGEKEKKKKKVQGAQSKSRKKESGLAMKLKEDRSEVLREKGMRRYRAQ